MRRCSRWVALLLALAESAAAQTPAPAAATASAAARPLEGHVLAVQEADIILDLSEAGGLAPGDRVALWRPLSIKHPITGRQIRDRFRIGTLSITQARPHLSLAVASGKLERTPEPGDIVIVPAASDSAAPSSPASLSSPPSPSAAAAASSGLTSFPQDPDADALSRLFDSLRQQPLESRISTYATFIRDNPKNRHTAALREHLRELQAALRVASSADAPARVMRHHPPELALAGRPLSLGIQLDEPPPGVLVHYRSRGESTFRTAHGEPAGARYFTFTIPGTAVTEAGLDYFIESVDASGAAAALAGTSESPVKVRTRRDWDLEAPVPPGATAQLAFDYADYNRLRGNDRDLRIETDFACASATRACARCAAASASTAASEEPWPISTSSASRRGKSKKHQTFGAGPRSGGVVHMVTRKSRLLVLLGLGSRAAPSHRASRAPTARPAQSPACTTPPSR